MATATLATLVVLTSTSTCTVSNIDKAEAVFAPISTMEQCEKTASAIDARQNIRAFCIPAQ